MNSPLFESAALPHLSTREVGAVAEYVQLAASVTQGENISGAKVLAATWREIIREEEGGVARVLRAMRGRMDYPAARARNYPNGTGVTEVAAKTAVGTRMKRAGARFSPHGGQTVMLFRTAVLAPTRQPAPGTPCNLHGFDRRAITPPPWICTQP